MAAAQVRADALAALGEDAQRLTSLQQARADKGDASELDADRARAQLLASAGAQLTQLGAEVKGLETRQLRLRGCRVAFAAPAQ